MLKRLLGLVGLVVLFLILEGCSRDVPTRPVSGTTGVSPAVAPEAPQLVEQDINPRDFVRRVTNPYFPLTPGTVYNYAGTADGETETSILTVTDQTKRILGVTTTVVWDRVWVNGVLHEETFDWYAQDRAGNVWYFGEDSKEFDNGQVNTAGSWEAGVNGAQPGIIMLADPHVGDRYQQELAPGVAEDMARVSSVNRRVTVPAGEYDNVLTTLESTPLEPDFQEVKYYAWGIGAVLSEVKKGGAGRVELISVSSTATRASR